MYTAEIMALTGLQNLGSSCFLNCILQCVVNIQPLKCLITDYSCLGKHSCSAKQSKYKFIIQKCDVLNFVHKIEKEGREFCLLCSLNFLIAEYEKSAVPLSPVMLYESLNSKC